MSAAPTTDIPLEPADVAARSPHDEQALVQALAAILARVCAVPAPPVEPTPRRRVRRQPRRP